MTRDLRKYASQTNLRLVFGVILLLLIVGLGLIAVLYGIGGALTGLICLLGAAVPIGLIWLFLFGLDWIVKKANEED
jgi:hypothetical protein